MPVPKSIVKFDKNGIKYVSNVERTEYTIFELSRAALRDVGKFVCQVFRQSFYQHFHKVTGNVGKNTQYWVKTKTENPELQVGIKRNGFYGIFQEIGSSKTKKLGLLQNAVNNNIAEIINIESKYLSALEDDARALSLIDEGEYGGDADE
jgi:HK97 gp10 family phage protein